MNQKWRKEIATEIKKAQNKKTFFIKKINKFTKNVQFLPAAVHLEAVVAQPRLRWRPDVVLGRPLNCFLIMFDKVMSTDFLKRLKR